MLSLDGDAWSVTVPGASSRRISAAVEHIRHGVPGQFFTAVVRQENDELNIALEELKLSQRSDSASLIQT